MKNKWNIALWRCPHVLTSQTGETLVEALVALLVSTFGILMLTTAVVTAANVVRASREAATLYYKATTELAAFYGSDGKVSGDDDSTNKHVIISRKVGSNVSSLTTTYKVPVAYRERHIPGLKSEEKAMAYESKGPGAMSS